eukprot:CAMPEP_0173189948 /NCGR_PEP_ID=MMETSP1141-20130122/12080_1 /TAXON_ID=483371 /ORGANISM="non described non described, Strain CCMP2298" /LENGTH=58 /DNA_ID=CAMNT_0014114017 /DNA_START=133 /DNA_END=309 /DNA_ORIENTATION=-
MKHNTGEGIAPPAGARRGRGNDDEVMDVVGDPHTIVVVAILALVAWLSEYLNRVPCTC